MGLGDVFGWIGVITSLILICAPLPAVYNIWKNSSVGEISPYPYLSTLFSCSIWVLYALLHENSAPVMYVNSAGVIFEFAYVVVYLNYADKADEDESSQWPVRILVLELLTVGTLTILGKVFGVIPPDAFGYIGAASNIVMYAVPLIPVCEAYKERNVEDMDPIMAVEDMDPIMAVAMLLNASCWLIYGFILENYFVLVPNLVGWLSAGTQLAVYLKFGRAE